ncbi:MAG: hypothetical protein U9R60_13130 [Bacteroidota bacterium]|nr:hypothetical protein [Bacteroidota bacterium]
MDSKDSLKKGIEYFNKALALGVENNLYRRILLCYNLRGIIELGAGDTNKAIQYFIKEISELRATQSRNLNIGIGVLFLILILVGILFLRQNKLKNEHKSTLLELQKLRYPDKFDYYIDVDDAIEHGIRHKKEMGRIDVRFFLKGKKILCEVEDDGVGREKAWEAEISERGDRKSLAIGIIKDRIKVLNKKFKQKIRLEIIDKRSDDYRAIGTKIRIDLPYGSVY